MAAIAQPSGMAVPPIKHDCSGVDLLGMCNSIAASLSILLVVCLQKRVGDLLDAGGGGYQHHSCASTHLSAHGGATTISGMWQS